MQQERKERRQGKREERRKEGKKRWEIVKEEERGAGGGAEEEREERREEQRRQCWRCLPLLRRRRRAAARRLGAISARSCCARTEASVRTWVWQQRSCDCDWTVRREKSCADASACFTRTTARPKAASRAALTPSRDAEWTRCDSSTPGTSRNWCPWRTGSPPWRRAPWGPATPRRPREERPRSTTPCPGWPPCWPASSSRPSWWMLSGTCWSSSPCSGTGSSGKQVHLTSR